MKKSTHVGHCQACGRLQMLPSGKLSLHGYSVEHGFFSGTCRGAKELPFEQSCDLIAQFIVEAKSQLKSIEALQAKLREMPSEPIAWMHVYYRTAGYGARSSYRWEQVQMNVTFVPYRDSADASQGYVKYSFVDAEGNVHGTNLSSSVTGINRYDAPGKTDAELLLLTVQKFNVQYANFLEREAKNLRDYVKWQTERVRTWKRAELTPLVGKVKDDKQGFSPVIEVL